MVVYSAEGGGGWITNVVEGWGEIKIEITEFFSIFPPLGKKIKEYVGGRII